MIRVTLLSAILRFGGSLGIASIASIASITSIAAAAGTHAEGAAASGPAPAIYMPSFGDLMTMAVQPRHIKLGLAGQARNWTYATYELNELRNAFARIARTIPIYRTAKTGELFAAMTQTPLAAVSAAIASHDAARFRKAYAQLTAACNACHVSLDHAAIVIRAPSRAAFPDQRFEPAR